MTTPALPRGPSFGHLIRGLRLRYGWSQRHRAFIRMTQVGEHAFRIDVASGDRLPSWEPKRKQEQHALWYDKEGDDTPDAILDACGPLRRLAEAGGLGASHYREYFVGEDGEEIVDRISNSYEAHGQPGNGRAWRSE